MNRIYIVDDDIAIVKALENIIEDNDLGNVVGYNVDALEALDDIKKYLPDIVLVDFLMPKIEGIELVKKLREVSIDIKFIMISQVSSKDMIAKAYNSGIEFFINKPINLIEIERVMQNVTESLEMRRKLKAIEKLFNKEKKLGMLDIRIEDEVGYIKSILSRLGIIGEKGSDEILSICSYLIKSKTSIMDIKFGDICDIIFENPKAAEQRIRRAVNKGLSNIANLGLEDYLNETFTRYSNRLYSFQDVRTEMDYIRGKTKSGGRISVRKFIDGLMMEKDMNR
ncbi:MAG: response regulator [Bacillota bacterium]|nr:response regulator [Bacillota bacterium]